MNYQVELNLHLDDYKRRDLSVTEPGIFRYKGKELHYNHILPLASQFKNLLAEAEPAARAFLKKNPEKRHRYFHHLNSSQALAFNLFYPYFDGGSEAASALLRALGQQGILDKWEPEAVPEPDEGTNIDVLWTTEDRAQTLCEVKLSEADFGKARDDPRRREKLNVCYRPVLVEHFKRERLVAPAFFAAYQFNRCVWHLARADGNRLIFLLPRANENLWRRLEVLLSGVGPRTRNRISMAAIEDVFASLYKDEMCPKNLREYAKKLEHKYVI